MPQLNTESSHKYLIQLMVGEFKLRVLEISERPSMRPSIESTCGNPSGDSNFLVKLCAQFNVFIGHVCLQTGGRAGKRRTVSVALFVCYHDNSKLRASIFTRLCL